MSFLARALAALRTILVCAALPMLAVALPAAHAAEPAVVRVGVLQYGTVSWELSLMQRAGFAAEHGVRIEVVPLALKDATNVALQGGAVDVIVNDWIWVSRQRSEGRDYTFVPFSQAVGSILTHADSGIRGFADLRGKRLGVAGGALDKSWLLLRAYAKKTVGEDAARFLKADFAAPPLLNELALRGELPAVMNYWHYGARLKAAGLVEILDMRTILAGLGVEGELPLVGWVFSESWAKANPTAIEGFLRASAQAKERMLASDEAWDGLRPLMKVDDDASFIALRDGFRAGIPRVDREAAEKVAARIFDVLAAEGGPALVGKADALAPGTFWAGGTTR